MSFERLGLTAELLSAIQRQGYEAPTPIQARAVPPILAGRDMLARAQTGTGKTAAFSWPLLQRLAGAPNGRRGRRLPRALVLAPTRELAAQVGESVRAYGANLDLRHGVIFGGVGMQPQIDLLRRGVDVVVATPGRLLDHARQGTVDLSAVEILVLDEADRMLDMGFIHDIRKILSLLPAGRQNLLFSATYSPDIKRLADSLLRDPVTVEVEQTNRAADTVTQHVYRVAKTDKRDLLVHLAQSEQWYQALVFTRTKHGANRLAEQLNRAGLESAAIHGNKSQGARTQALAGFKRGKVRVLVATDIASRGLDIDRLPHVVNFELPNVPEDYVHRIGRTGRAGESGVALSLVSDDEIRLLHGIQRMLGKAIPNRPLPTFERRPPMAGDGPEGDDSRPPRTPRPAPRPPRAGASGDSRPGPRPGPAPGRGPSRPRRSTKAKGPRSGAPTGPRAGGVVS